MLANVSETSWDAVKVFPRIQWVKEFWGAFITCLWNLSKPAAWAMWDTQKLQVRPCCELHGSQGRTRCTSLHAWIRELQHEAEFSLLTRNKPLKCSPASLHRTGKEGLWAENGHTDWTAGLMLELGDKPRFFFNHKVKLVATYHLHYPSPNLSLLSSFCLVVCVQ